jgi:ubiquinone/menaquinone biosynthesis C-methylase UbiE
LKLEKLQATWNNLGRIDPMWAVLSDPTKLGHKWSEDEFFATGRQEVGTLMQSLEARLPLAQRRRALDFGCGLGRLVRAFAAYFDEVVGIDISPSMIEQAGKLNADIANCSWVLNGEDDLRVFPDDHFDLTHTDIVLQHMNPAFAKRYIAEFVRITAPGGTIVFQLPDVRPTSLVKRFRFAVAPFLPLIPKAILRPYLRKHYPNAPDDILVQLPDTFMEMHGERKDKVVAMMERLGAPVQFVDEEPGEGWVTYRYFARKRA